MDNSRYSSEIRNWMDEVQRNCEQDTELALKYCNNIIEYGKETDDENLLAFGYHYSSIIYYILNDGANFLESVTSALDYLNRIEEWELMARCYNLLGITSISRGNAAVALDYYLNAIKHCKKAGVEDFEASIMINIGSLELECGRYQEAIDNLEHAKLYFSKHTELERYNDGMICIYQNMAKAYLYLDEFDKARECFDNIFENHKTHCTDYVMATVLCTQAMYYHMTGDHENCEKTIAEVMRQTSENMPIMDLFDDYYEYCKVLLERKKENEFWKIVELMEPKVKTLGITNLQIKMLSLKIKFYREYGYSAEYLQAAALHYELIEKAEEENKAVMNGILHLRKKLEKTKREKKEMEKKNEMLVKKSETDALTKLNNRFRLNDYSEIAFQKAYDNKTTLAVEILDMDDFKGFNDYYGHQVGDECIIKVASAIKSMEEEHGAFVARYGGDEFILIYEGITKEQAVEYAAELRQKVMDLEIPHIKSKVSDVMTISQGMCCDIPVDNNRMWDFLHAADVMLYRVKGIKRNNYCVGNLRMTEGQVVISCK